MVDLTQPRTTEAFRTIRRLLLAYLAAPGTFPAWLKVEQGVCGLLMAGVAVVANRPRPRALFGAPRTGE